MLCATRRFPMRYATISYATISYATISYALCDDFLCAMRDLLCVMRDVTSMFNVLRYATIFNALSMRIIIIPCALLCDGGHPVALLKRIAEEGKIQRGVDALEGVSEDSRSSTLKEGGRSEQ